MANANREAFTAGMAKGKVLMRQHIRDIFARIASETLKDLCLSKEYTGFTGNTQTSYTCGYYEDGELKYLIVQDDFNRPPVRAKIPKGRAVYLSNPYEGKGRAVVGRVNVDNLSGQNSAFEFLKSYHNVPAKGYALVATTGTEYSEYLENVRNLNVMTRTWEKAPVFFKSNAVPMEG